MPDPIAIAYDSDTDTAQLRITDAAGVEHALTLDGAALVPLFMETSAAVCRRHRLPGQSQEDPHLVHGIRQYTLRRILPGNGLVLSLDLASGAQLTCYTGNTQTPEFARSVAELWRGEVDLPEPMTGPDRRQ